YRKKKKLAFLSWSSLTLCALIVVYVTVLKVSERIFPQLEVEHISLITYWIQPDFKLSIYLEELAGFAVGFSLFWIMFTLAGFYYDQQKQVKRMEAAILEHREAELSFLRGQINPHFLF